MVLPARLGPQATSWLSLLLVVHLQLCLKQHYFNYILDTFVSCLWCLSVVCHMLFTFISFYIFIFELLFIHSPSSTPCPEEMGQRRSKLDHRRQQVLQELTETNEQDRPDLQDTGLTGTSLHWLTSRTQITGPGADHSGPTNSSFHILQHGVPELH